MEKIHFSSPTTMISHPITKKYSSIKLLFEGEGLINNEYHFCNETMMVTLNSVIRETPSILYPYIQNAQTEQNIKLIIDIDMFIHIITKHEYYFNINKNELLLSTKESENHVRFSFMCNMFLYFINTGGLLNYARNNKKIFEFIINKSNGLLGNPTYVTNTYCTTELCSLQFRELKPNKLNSMTVSNFNLRLDEIDDSSELWIIYRHNAFF